MEDHIIRLPSDLRVHILSFLSTREALRTTVLSKSWNPLLKYVSTLDLRDSDFPLRGNDSSARKTQFLTFVDQFLLQRNPPNIRKILLTGFECYDPLVLLSWLSFAREHIAQEIDLNFRLEKLPSNEFSQRSDYEFSLSLRRVVPFFRNGNNVLYTGRMFVMGFEGHDQALIQSWISFAIEWNIEELSLLCASESLVPSSDIPQSLFACRMLVVLNLEGLMVVNFPWTSSKCFPHLETLYLTGVFFSDEMSAFRLINRSSPVLKDLFINGIDRAAVPHLIINSQSLKRLDICFQQHHDVRTIHLMTQIDAPALNYLTIHDKITSRYQVRDLSSVGRVSLAVKAIFKDPEYANVLLGFLGGLRMVQYLSLSWQTMLALETAEIENLAMFRNLTFLELNSSQLQYSNEYVSWKLMHAILLNAPRLVQIKIQGFKFNFKNNFEHAIVDPDCVISRMEVLTIIGLGERQEVDFVEYFLKNSEVLELVTVRMDEDLPNREGLIAFVSQRLSTCPRASILCQLCIS